MAKRSLKIALEKKGDLSATSDVSEKPSSSHDVKPKERLRWVDAAKAISMIAIIMGHVAPWFWDGTPASYLPYARGICTFVYSFHVPLFFLLSGYTMSSGIMGPRKIGKLFIRTFIPYIVTGALTIIYCMAVLPDQDLLEWLAALVYGAGLYRGELVWSDPFGAVAIGAIWFLPALFIGKVISSFISRLPGAIRVLIVGVLFGIGEVTAGILFLPFDIQQGLCASFFITCGMMLKEQKAFESVGVRRVVLTVCATIGVGYTAAMLFIVMYNPVYTNSLYPNGILDALGTVCASIAVIAVAQVMGSLNNPIEKALEVFGRSTLPIFCFHSIMMATGTNNNIIINQICEDGMDPNIVFVLALFICIAIPILLSMLCRVVPGLRHVYYPGKGPFFKKKTGNAAHKQKSETRTKENSDVAVSKKAFEKKPEKKPALHIDESKVQTKVKTPEIELHIDKNLGKKN